MLFAQPRTDVRKIQYPNLERVSAIQVFYVESPLFFEDFGDAASHINGFHAGLVFRYYPSSPEVSFVLEFSGVDVIGSIFPEVSSPPKFRNEAFVWYRPYVNQTYWSKASYVATLNTEQFQKLYAWAQSYEEKYQLWALVQNGKESVLYESQTCVDFVWKALEFLKSLDVAMDFLIPLKRDYINVHASDAPELQTWELMSDTEQEQLVSFYAELSPETFLSIMKDLQMGNFTQALNELISFAARTHNVFYIPDVSKEGTFWRIPVHSSEMFLTLDYSDGGFHSPDSQWEEDKCEETHTSYFAAFLVALMVSILFLGIAIFYFCQYQRTKKVDGGGIYIRQTDGVN